MKLDFEEDLRSEWMDRSRLILLRTAGSGIEERNVSEPMRKMMAGDDDDE